MTGQPLERLPGLHYGGRWLRSGWSEVPPFTGSRGQGASLSAATARKRGEARSIGP